MTKLVRSFLLWAVLCSPAMLCAQDGSQQVRQDTPRVVQRLALSREQQVQFHAIHKDQKMKLEAVKSDPSLSPRMRREKTREIRQTAEGKIRAMLNQNQLEEWDQIKRERQENSSRRRETTVPQQ